MITENLSTLKINKLTQKQYERELANGNIDEYGLYLTPDVTDQTYNPDSENAQSGKAVAEAIDNKMDKFGDVLVVDSGDDEPPYKVLNFTNPLVISGNDILTIDCSTLILGARNGNIICNNQVLTNIGEPTDGSCAATKSYVDNLIGDINSVLATIVDGVE